MEAQNRIRRSHIDSADRLPLNIRHYAATGIVSGRDNRYRLLCHIDTQFQAAGMDIREVTADKRLSLITDVKRRNHSLVVSFRGRLRVLQCSGANWLARQMLA